MTILLKMQACEIELVVGLGILRRESSLSGIGNRTYLVGFGTPLQVVGLERQSVQRGSLYVNALLNEHLLRAQVHLLIIINHAVVILQHDMHVLFAGRIKFEPNGAILVLVDIEDKILRGNLDRA